MNQLSKKWTPGLIIAAGICAAAAALPARAESIVTGGKTGTYFAIGNNLRDFVNRNKRH